MSKNIERVLDVNPYTTSGRGSRFLVPAELIVEFACAESIDVEEVVVGESYVAVDGLIKVVDVGETQPEVAQRPVYGLSQSVRH